MVWRNVARNALSGGRSPAGIYRLTETQFEALTQYDWDAIYRVDGVGVYHGPTLIEYETWAPAVGDLYVATDGDDAEDGTDPEAPKLTIWSAFNSIAAAGGVTIWVAAGTYTENVEASGYFLFSNKAFTNPVTIRGIPGTLPILTNASGSYVFRPNGNSANIHLRNLKITGTASVLRHVYFDNASLLDFSVKECVIEDANSEANSIGISGTIQTNIELKRNICTSAGACAVTVSNCTNAVIAGNDWTGTTLGTFVASGGTQKVNSNRITGEITLAGHATTPTTLEVKGNTCRNIAHTGGATGNRSVLTVSDNTVTAGTGVRGIAISGYTTGGRCTNNSVTSLGDTGLGWPIDGGTSVCVGHTISGNTVINHGTTGHGILVSTGGTDVIVSNNSTDCGSGGSYGCVIKGTDNIVRNNTFIGGSLNGALLKDGTGIQFLNNTVTSDGVSAVALRFDNADFCTVTGNTFNVTDGTLHAFTESTNESNVVDDNRYLIGVDAGWGTMFGNAVSSLANVQAQWSANYETGPTNDANSTDV